MKIILGGGAEYVLGDAEATPTIGMTDYSRRETDDFGVTTVIPRGFARKMSLRLAMPFADTGLLQKRLAAVRATPVRWQVDPDYKWLDFSGFYKDFSIDLAVPPTSYCTLSVEGLTETETVTDAGGEAAPAGQVSTMLMIDPVEITNSVFVSSTVPESDHAAWSNATTYALGARVIKTATHRIYESLAAGNLNKDPETNPGYWTDVGPTNRWAMFDEALGTVTAYSAGIQFVLAAGPVTALAVLDTTATACRVVTTGYEQTVAVVDGNLVLTDLPAASANITVTLSSLAGPVSVGTFLVGKLVKLGVTAADPSAGTTDYSKKEVDDFGGATIVERAWAKKMTVTAAIATTALDMVANRIANARARPAYWIADAGTQPLSIYGFFKDFSIEVGPTVSMLSLSVEGLSNSAPPIAVADPAAWTATYSQTNVSGDFAPAISITGAIDDIYAEQVKFEYWRSNGVDAPTAVTDWVSEGVHGRDVVRHEITGIGPSSSYYVAVSYVQGGKAGERRILGPIAVGAFPTALGAINAIADIASDSLLTPNEKPRVIQDRDEIVAEQSGLDAQAVAFSITTERTAYNNSVTALTTYLATLASPVLWSNLGGNTTIVGATFRTKFLDVYSARQALLNKIAEVAKARADLAVSNAATAQSSANTANAAIADIASDSLLTPDEKPGIIRDRDEITAEQSGIGARATAYSITTEKTTYDNAVSALTTYLATLTTPVLWSNLGGNTTIVGATFRTKFLDVYAARQALLNKIAEKAGEYALWENIPANGGRPESNATLSDNLIKDGSLTDISSSSYYLNPTTIPNHPRVSGAAGEPGAYFKCTGTTDIRCNNGQQLLGSFGGARCFMTMSVRLQNRLAQVAYYQIWQYDAVGTLLANPATGMVPSANNVFETVRAVYQFEPATARIAIFVGAQFATVAQPVEITDFRISFTERDASIPVQVSIVGGQDKKIAADYTGAVTGTYSLFAPTVLRNGVSIKTDNTVTYAVTKLSDGTAGADGGTISLDNTTASSTKGNVTPSAFNSGSALIKWQLEVKVNGVTADKIICTLAKDPATPPAGGGGGGGGGSGDKIAQRTANQAQSATSYAPVSNEGNPQLTVASGEKLYAAGIISYYCNGSTAASRFGTFKNQYSVNNTTWTDFGSAISGSNAFSGYISTGNESVDPVPGSVDVAQNVTPGAGTYYLRTVFVISATGRTITLQGEKITYEAKP